MNIDDIFKISTAILASVGGASIIIIGLSTWLGKVWANRILEKDKLKYTSELEVYRSQLQNESQKQNLIFSTYYSEQFKLYNNLWVSLSELQTGVEELWEEASPERLKTFVFSFEASKKTN